MTAFGLRSMIGRLSPARERHPNSFIRQVP